MSATSVCAGPSRQVHYGNALRIRRCFGGPMTSIIRAFVGVARQSLRRELWRSVRRRRVHHAGCRLHAAGRRFARAVRDDRRRFFQAQSRVSRGVQAVVASGAGDGVAGSMDYGCVIQRKVDFHAASEIIQVAVRAAGHHRGAFVELKSLATREAARAGRPAVADESNRVCDWADERLGGGVRACRQADEQRARGEPDGVALSILEFLKRGHVGDPEVDAVKSQNPRR